MVCCLELVQLSSIKGGDITLCAGKKIKGIKITDAASKKKVKKLLAAEQALREMDVDKAAGWTEAGACEAME